MAAPRPLSNAIVPTQVDVTTESAEAVAYRETRHRVILVNMDASGTVYVGTGTVSATNGTPLRPYDSIALETSAAINAVASAGTLRLAVLEEYWLE